MNVFWGLGKLLTLLFWLVVLVNQLMPFVNPLHLLVDLVASLLALIHLLEAVFCYRTLRGRAHPWRDRLKVLFFGVFHLQTIPAPTAPKASHA
jgi:putative membrane protein